METKPPMTEDDFKIAIIAAALICAFRKDPPRYSFYSDALREVVTAVKVERAALGREESDAESSSR